MEDYRRRSINTVHAWHIQGPGFDSQCLIKPDMAVHSQYLEGRGRKEGQKVRVIFNYTVSLRPKLNKQTK